MANPGNLAAQRLVHQLHAGGMSYSEIGRRVGRDSSLISQIARKGNKGASLVSALQQVQGGAKHVEVPRKVTKAGTPAKVRRGIQKVPGSDNLSMRTKTGNTSLIRFLRRAGTKPVKWKVKVKTAKTTSDRLRKDTGFNGGSSRPGLWTADQLLDRVQNPRAGDPWQPGDARHALAEIARRENSNAITSYAGLQEIQAYTVS